MAEKETVIKYRAELNGLFFVRVPPKNENMNMKEDFLTKRTFVVSQQISTISLQITVNVPMGKGS